MTDPMTQAERDAEVARLLSLMVKQPYYVMHRRFVAPDRVPAALLDHLRWLIGIEKQGLVFLSGPLTAPDGTMTGGMTVFRCASLEAAEALAAADPFAVAGAIEYSVQRWQVNEGRLSLSFDFSDGAVSLG